MLTHAEATYGGMSRSISIGLRDESMMEGTDELLAEIDREKVRVLACVCACKMCPSLAR